MCVKVDSTSIMVYLQEWETLDGVKEYYRSLLGRQHRRSRWRLKAVLYTDISDNSKPHEKPTPRSSESLTKNLGDFDAIINRGNRHRSSSDLNARRSNFWTCNIYASILNVYNAPA